MKLSYLRKSKSVKISLLTGGMTLLFQALSPTISYALTGGPQQPEFQGFTQIDTGNLVDPFTGDFKYQIPLLTVPGPNGGYPLNLTYAAGPSLEEEASWVGLGWSLNVGAVNRQMRGVPDDFMGDVVVKKQYTKPNTTIGFGLGMVFTLQEVYGADLGTNLSLGINSQFYMNNYNGFGYRNSISPSFGLTSADNESSAGLSAGLSLNFDSNEGADIQPNFGLKSRDGKNSVGMDFGFGYSGRQGFQGMYMSTSYTKHSTSNPSLVLDRKVKEHTGSRGSSYSFAVASGVPRTTMPLEGTNFSFSIKPDLGGADNQFKIPITFQGRFSQQKLSSETSNQWAYGLHYAGEEPYQGGNYLMDYNLEKDAAINIKVPNLPIPVSTHDIYNVQASQLSLSFRNYRNDMGLFYEPPVYSVTLGAEVGVEAGAGTGFKVGVNPRISYAQSYSGLWKGNAAEVLGKYKFRGSSDNALLTDANGVRKNAFTYMKVSGEPTADVAGSGFRMSMAGGKSGAVKFPINTTDASNPNFTDDEMGSDYDGPNIFGDVQQFTTAIGTQLGSQALGTNVNAQKQRRNTLIEYRTQTEVESQQDGILKGSYISSTSNTSSTTTFNVNGTFTYPTEKGHHMAEYSVLEPGGMRYTFGLPAYNKLQKDVTFAISVAEQSDVGNNDKLISYGTADKIRNYQGRDMFYSMTEMPAYSHSHLLTLITSPDYVDVTDDGPSEDDYGYYVKFNYYKAHDNYKWRTPYEAGKANHHKGYYSSALDNKASYVYGEKEVWYVHSIETKTHVAIFILEDRKDAKGTTGTSGGLGGQSLKRLKEIRLYAKKQIVGGVLPAKPIKTVVFNYSYRLCPGVPNFDGGSFDEEEDVAEGKLTLESIHFLYNGNKRGELNPYRFAYGSNPEYSNMQSDRWGNYRSDTASPLGSNEENPYVDQDESSAARTERNQNAGAWSVSEIITPSNARIRVNYESDDYAFVQDRLATQMFQVIGTGDGSDVKLLDCDYVNGLGISGEEHIPISKDYKRIYFRPEISQAELSAMSAGERNSYVKSHIAGLADSWLYFKTWQRLQRPKNRTWWAEDYVTGYAKVVYPQTAGTDYGIYYHSATGSYIPFLKVEQTDNNAIKNPIQLAGLQYLRYSRGDLNMPQDINNNGGEAAITMITTGLTMILQQVELIMGYYSYARLNNYCKFIEKDKPSFVRLTTPDGTKYGGGHRVSSVVVYDGWDESSLAQEEYAYKQDYYYDLEDGKSSGVAAYEPALGNDENALKYPHYFSPDNKFNNDPAFLTEAPFNESYYPSPVVGYSRVVVRSDINYNDKVLLSQTVDDVKASGDGIRLYEFYTARDYPVYTENTPAENVKNKIPIPIPLIGGIQITNYGYSQGYMIELNDMHGKAKTETTYAASAWDYDHNRLKQGAPFVSSKSYKYNTVGNYNPQKANRINSTLCVLDNEHEMRFAVVGESADVFSNLREDSGFSLSAGVQINGGVDVLPYMGFVMAFPGIEYSENTARISVTNKVVYKTGMITEVVERMEGAVKTTSNLIFDAENGQPLLTAVTTDYDDHTDPAIDAPIYTYSMPAQWYYDGMQAAHNNYRTVLEVDNIVATGTFLAYPMTNVKQYLQPGDEVYYTPESNPTAIQHYWVDEVVSNGTDEGFVLKNGQGNYMILPLDGSLEIIRSGFRNLQNQTAGTIVSLNNPVVTNFAFFTTYNSQIYGHNTFMGINVNVSSFDPEAFEGIEFPNPCMPETTYTFTTSPDFMTDNSNTGTYVETIRFPDIDYTVEGEGDTRGCPFNIHLFDIGEGLIPANDFYFNRIRFYNSGSGQGWAYYDLSTGVTIKLGFSFDGDACPYLICLDGILDAKAVEYSDTWSYPGDFPVPLSSFNLWSTTGRGVWRVLRTNTYFTERKQEGGAPGFNSFIGRDGTYKDFIPFNFGAGNANNQQQPNGWRWAAEVPNGGYGRGGYELENKNALDIYSSEIFGFGQSAVIAVAANARYHEIGFESFERPGETATYTGPLSYFEYLSQGESNHITPMITLFDNFEVSSEKSHTGLRSLKLKTDTYPLGLVPLNIKVIDPQVGPDNNYDGIQVWPGQKYMMSYWFYDGYNGGSGSIMGSVSGASVNAIVVATGQTVFEEVIDGWRKNTLEFTAPNSPNVPLIVYIFANGESTYIDDIRIHPVDASFKSYVYDPLKFNLKAELDDNNYATFYNYNQEGNLFQVKKETKDGIKTIRTTLKHVKPNAN